MLNRVEVKIVKTPTSLTFKEIFRCKRTSYVIQARLANAHCGKAEHIKPDGDKNGEYAFYTQMLLESVMGGLYVDCMEGRGRTTGGRGWMRVRWIGC